MSRIPKRPNYMKNTFDDQSHVWCRLCEWFGRDSEAEYTGIAPDRTIHPLCADHAERMSQKYSTIAPLTKQQRENYINSGSPFRRKP